MKEAPIKWGDYRNKLIYVVIKSREYHSRYKEIIELATSVVIAIKNGGKACRKKKNQF